MRVLYVATSGAPDSKAVLADIFRHEPDLEVKTITSAAGALADIRSAGGYAALFVAPSVPHGETIELITSLRRDRPALLIVAIIADDDRDFSAPAVAAGADDILVLRGKRLIGVADTLRRIRQSRNASSQALPDEATAGTSMEALRAENERLLEAQAFERAMRERDREELASFRRALREEQERRIVLEGTLRHTEDRARAELSALEEALNEERRRLHENVADAADRLHRVATTTHGLQDRIDRQLADREGERERLLNNALVGHAVFARDGQLIRCTATFASMLGYESADAAVYASKQGAFASTPDHARIVQALDRGEQLDRKESTLRKVDGRPLRVVTSASLLPTGEIERLFVDLSDRMKLEVELRLARRLESAGRLAAEMGPEIESALAAGATDPAELQRAALLTRQLLAFSRYQAKPAGFLSLNDAISRHESLLRQIAGESIDLQLRLAEIEPVTAGEDEIEHLLIELAVSAAGVLPFGGTLTIATASDTDPTFVLRTSLTAVSAGYGVLSANPSPSLARLVARCGGVLRISGDAGRTSTLHVSLPC